MIVRDTFYRKVAQWLNTNWEQVTELDTFVEVAEAVSHEFGQQVNTSTVSTIMYAIAGARDSFEDVPMWSR